MMLSPVLLQKGMHKMYAHVATAPVLRMLQQPTCCHTMLHNRQRGSQSSLQNALTF